MSTPDTSSSSKMAALMKKGLGSRPKGVTLDNTNRGTKLNNNVHQGSKCIDLVHVLKVGVDIMPLKVLYPISSDEESMVQSQKMIIEVSSDEEEVVCPKKLRGPAAGTRSRMRGKRLFYGSSVERRGRWY